MRQLLFPIWIDWLRSRVHDLAQDDPLNFTRASGDMACEVCGREFWRHPLHDFLHQLCDGSWVKL